MVAKNKELSPRTQYIIERHGTVIFIWLLTVVLSIFKSLPKLQSGELAGNDDYMRMVQIRDWLGGQSWYDMHQYRLYPENPLLSHWSRIPDLLIGLPIKALTPILGAQTAELVISIAYPAVLLLIALYLITEIIKYFTKNKVGFLLGVFYFIIAFSVLSQFQPGRIDHHNLQIVLGLGVFYYILASLQNPKRIIIAGILGGIGLAIGIEGAPILAAAIVSVVLIWVFDESNSTKKLRSFGLALAVTSLAILLLEKPPKQWFVPACDALSVVYIQMTAGIAIVLWVLSRAGYKIKSKPARFSLAAILGMLILVFIVMLYPECLRGPYSGLDERITDIWLSNVAEAGSFISFVKSEPLTAVNAVFLPLLALFIYVWIAVKNKQGWEFPARSLLIFILFCTLAGLIQIRVLFFANVFSIPLIIMLLAKIWEYFDQYKNRLLRTFAKITALIILSPLPVLFVLSLEKSTNNDNQAQHAKKSAIKCNSASVLKSLNNLPKGTILTQIDLGAPVLKLTHHSVTAAPYHRNIDGIISALDAFIENEKTSYKTVKKAKANYVLACVKGPETNLMLKYGKNGLLAQFIAGETPDWLEKIPTKYDKQILLYKVKSKAD